MNIFLTAAKEIVLKKEEKRLIEIIRDVLAGKNKSEWSMQISKEEIERVIKRSFIHILRCRRSTRCRSRGPPGHQKKKKKHKSTR